MSVESFQPDDDTRRRLIGAARTAATALAKFWDELYQVEQQHDIEFDGTVRLIEDLASAVPDHSAVDDDMVWEQIEACRLGR